MTQPQILQPEELIRFHILAYPGTLDFNPEISHPTLLAPMAETPAANPPE